MNGATAIAELDDYYEQAHGSITVTPEQIERFLAAMPEDARPRFMDGWVPDNDIGDVVEEIKDYLLDYSQHCHHRPALPHEREEWGCVWFLTRIGEGKFRKRQTAMGDAFAAAFGMQVVDGEGGTLDPLTYY